jgi:hypothetical protein
MKREWKESVSVGQVIALLNEALACDREWVERMTYERKFCNKALADHPAIQVDEDAHGQGYSAGLLAIVNGMFGTDEKGWGRISAIRRGGRIVRFERTECLGSIPLREEVEKANDPSTVIDQHLNEAPGYTPAPACEHAGNRAAGFLAGLCQICDPAGHAAAVGA